MTNEENIASAIFESNRSNTKTENYETVSLSVQAIKTIMLVLQNGILEERDLTKDFEGLKFVLTNDGLVVLNPPIVKMDMETLKEQNADVQL